MGVIEEYLERGGMYGIAQQTFLDEWKKAYKDKAHPLREAVTAFKKNNQEQATHLIIEALTEAGGNESSPLSSLFLVLCKLPMINSMREYAEDNFYDNNALKGMPLEIIRLASAGVITHEINSRKGSAKGKANREKIIAEWVKYGSKKKGAQAFAEWLFKNWGGNADKDGNTEKGVPSIKTIAKTVRDYKKTLPDTSIG